MGWRFANSAGQSVSTATSTTVLSYVLRIQAQRARVLNISATGVSLVRTPNSPPKNAKTLIFNSVDTIVMVLV